MRPGNNPEGRPGRPEGRPGLIVESMDRSKSFRREDCWRRRNHAPGNGRPDHKLHPRVDGVRRTRDRLSSVRFRDGRGSRSPLRNLVAENALLRQQLIVAERKLAGRVRWTPWQRFMIVLTARVAPAWRDAILLIQPATILRWHRAGFRAFWRRRSRRPGRPPSPRAALSGR